MVHALLSLAVLLLAIVMTLSLRPSYSSSNRHSNTALSSTQKKELVYAGLSHCGILVKDTQKSKQFFMDVFGFLDESHLRPTKLPYPGAFLRCGAHQIHLMELPNPDPLENRPEHVGRDRHIALDVNDIDILKESLESRGIPYTMSQSGRRALFCRDIDMNGFEFVENTNIA